MHSGRGGGLGGHEGFSVKAHKPLYFSYLDRRHRGVPVAYATYHGREGFGFGESHMTWQPGAPAIRGEM